MFAFFSFWVLDSDISNLESKSSWEILIKNGNSALGVITRESTSSINIIKLNMEIHIWLPLVVVNNWNLNLDFKIFLRDRVLLVVLLVVLAWDGRSFGGSNTKVVFASGVDLEDSQFNMAVGFGD